MMHSDHMSPGIPKTLDISFRAFNHKMHIQRFGCLLLQHLHDRESKADIRHEHSIHDIYVKPVSVTAIDQVDDPVEISEIGGKDGWGYEMGDAFHDANVPLSPHSTPSPNSAP